jgi:hypothetical protein
MEGCPPECYHNADPAMARAYVEKWLSKAHEKDLAVLSLSAIPDDILMWAHYASCHTGVCLELAVPLDNGLHKIQYRDARPVFYYADTDDQYRDVKRFQRSVLDTLTVKSTHWRYEQEWRCIDFEGRGLKPLPIQMLTGIIFGCRTLEEHKRQIGEWVSQRGAPVQLYQAQQKERDYGLNIVDIAP